MDDNNTSGEHSNQSQLEQTSLPTDPLAQEWERVSLALKEEIGDTAFRSWIRPLTFSSIDGLSLQLKTPTRFMRDWVQGHYVDQIIKLWSQDVQKINQIDITIDAAKEKEHNKNKVKDSNNIAGSNIANENLYDNALSQSELNKVSSPLDSRFTFENFIVGKPNELAHAAARRIAESDTVSFNPLYIYGGVGLGKTHLMHAIAWHLKELRPEKRVLYLSAEKFMYQFIRSLRFKDSLAFKERFRSVDVLMIDDIQFISGKKSTQEEFFHTFNALIDQNKQIIVTADRSPSDLIDIEDRLKSRLSWGLVADIHTTTYDLRLGILHAKCEQLGANVPTKVLEFLAHKICSNVRELEGALNRVVAHAELVGRPITIEYVQEVLHDLLKANNRRINIDQIQRAVVEHFGIRMPDMKSARRSRNIARPRQIAMYLAKQLTPRSLPEIGRQFGGRDHTTVMHAVRTIEKLCAEDSSFSDDVSMIRRTITEKR